MLKTSVLLGTALIVLCDSAKINVKKCSIKDDACLQSLYMSFIQEVTDNGLPEMDIPKVDPFIIKDMSVQLLDMINVTVVDGAAKGFKSCHITIFKNDIEAGHTVVELMCDVFAIEASYIIESTPTLLALTGGIKVHGDGKGSITVEKLKLNIDFAYEVKKHDDGELHFTFKPEESSYKYEVLGKAAAAGNNIFVGKEDISTVTVNIINENWMILSKAFGKIVIDKALEVFYMYAQKFNANIPVKDIITEDLSSYVQ